MAQHNRRPEDDERLEGSTVVEKKVFGTELYVYSGRSGCVYVSTRTWLLRIQCVYPCTVSTYTFWRFLIQIPLSGSEMKIQYSINDGLALDFFVPGCGQTMRLAAYSVSDPFIIARRVILTSVNVVQRVL
jgi:hypothetical protein